MKFLKLQTVSALSLAGGKSSNLVPSSYKLLQKYILSI